jgi:hypothetical protein
MKKILAPVLETTFYVGVADMLLAITEFYVVNGKFPERLLKYIASGLLGLEKGMAGGVGAEMLGLFIHFSICFLFTLFYFLVYPFIRPLARKFVVSGLLYAVFVNLTMNLVLLPMTSLPAAGPFLLARAFLTWVLLGLVLGIPIAYFARKHYDAGSVR